MDDTSILILPGLDGTDLMLGPFLELCLKDRLATVAVLPDDPHMDYLELAEYFSEKLSGHSSVHVIAESFSGPIGVLLAHNHPNVVQRLTLVASFVTSPVPRIASILPWSTIFRLPMPSWVASRYFVGSDFKLIPILQSAVQQHDASTLRHRFRLVQTVDVSQVYSELKCRITYIRPTGDRLVPYHCVNTIMNNNPAIELHRIGGPHLILQTQPFKSWQTIAE